MMDVCFFSPVISTNTHHSLNNIFHDFKVLKKVIITETFNIKDFQTIVFIFIVICPYGMKLK